MVPSSSADITRAMLGQEKRLSRDYNPRQKSCCAYPLLQYLSGKFISSPPFPRFNVVYRDKFVIVRFQHCRGRGGGGRGGVPYSSYAISYCFKIACQRMFQLSDPGVLGLLSWIVPETNWRERHCVCFDFVSLQRCFMPSQSSFLFGQALVSFFLVWPFI